MIEKFEMKKFNACKEMFIKNFALNKKFANALQYSSDNYYFF